MLSSLLQLSINIHLPGAGASLNYIVDSSHYWPPPAHTRAIHGHSHHRMWARGHRGHWDNTGWYPGDWFLNQRRWMLMIRTERNRDCHRGWNHFPIRVLSNCFQRIIMTHNAMSRPWRLGLHWNSITTMARSCIVKRGAPWCKHVGEEWLLISTSGLI